MEHGRDPIVIERSSRVARSAEVVWDVVSDLTNVNAELMPFIFMRVPRGADVNSLTRSDIGRPLFVSWLFFFGFLPIDRHVVGIENLVERGFDERSHSLFHAIWRHQRRVVADGDGAIVSDRVEIVPRFGWLAAPVGWFVGQVFSHRHDQLKALFGAR